VTYRVVLKAAAAKALEKLPADVTERIERCIDALALNPKPPGVVKMQGDANLWRIRVGDYRIVYEIHDATILILVLNIVHRRDIYR
jgi:mRNA interferase RelE/StbE